MQDCTVNYERQCDEESPCEYHDTRPQFYSAAIYMVDRSYGGPEEGGWYYDSGEPVLRETDIALLMRNFPNAKSAWEYANGRLARKCKELNKGRRSYTSVLGNGEYRPNVTRGLPDVFPARRPHYE